MKFNSFYTIILMIIPSLYSVSYASDNEIEAQDDLFTTPKTSPRDRLETVAKTPGKIVSENLRELLTFDNFKKFYSINVLYEHFRIEEFRQDKKLKQEKSLEIKESLVKNWYGWEKFSNPNLEFEESDFKAPLIRKIIPFVAKAKAECDQENAEFSKFLLSIFKLPESIKQVHIQRIQNIAKQYFIPNVYQDCSIDFCTKEGKGRQLGLIATITSPVNEEIKFYIKTHANGLLSQDSSGAKPLDAKELFVYKMLEKLEIGCECHFFGRDQKNFYIATKSAASYGLSFDEYDTFKKQINLENINSSVKSGIVELDILSRLLRLTDVGTNGGNFGFVQDRQDEENYLMKIIDFGIAEGSSYEIEKAHFKGFLNGNGIYNYDPIIVQILQEDKKEITETYALFLKLHDKLLKDNIVDTSKQEVEKIIGNALPKSELDNYASAIKENFELFKQLFENYLEHAV